MTDLELTRLCAEAMGLSALERCDEFGDDQYKPLYDDAQAMALLKRFNLAIGRNNDRVRVRFTHGCLSSWKGRADLNRAICEAVAKMQKAQSERTALTDRP